MLLPNRFNSFAPKYYVIYMLDIYIVHLPTEIRPTLLKHGYVLVVIRGGLTGDIQINDTDDHRHLKASYRKLVQEPRMRQLSDNPLKIPQSCRDGNV